MRRHYVRRGQRFVIASTNPATGEALASFEPPTDAELGARVALAAESLAAYKNTSFSYCGRMVRAAEILEREKESFGRLTSVEIGKPVQSAINEAAKCAWGCRCYAEDTEQFLTDEAVATSARPKLYPVSTTWAILAIMLWNYSFWHLVRFVALIARWERELCGHTLGTDLDASRE
jgi:succinate-semialdehyde dehydrogenase/glutarate-semialdehyde dehydrogenase